MGVLGEPPQAHANVTNTCVETVDGNNPAPPNQYLMKDQARDTKLRCEMFSLALPLINVVQQ